MTLGLSAAAPLQAVGLGSTSNRGSTPDARWISPSQCAVGLLLAALAELRRVLLDLRRRGAAGVRTGVALLVSGLALLAVRVRLRLRPPLLLLMMLPAWPLLEPASASASPGGALLVAMALPPPLVLLRDRLLLLVLPLLASLPERLPRGLLLELIGSEALDLLLRLVLPLPLTPPLAGTAVAPVVSTVLWLLLDPSALLVPLLLLL